MGRRHAAHADTLAIRANTAHGTCRALRTVRLGILCGVAGDDIRPVLSIALGSFLPQARTRLALVFAQWQELFVKTAHRVEKLFQPRSCQVYFNTFQIHGEISGQLSCPLHTLRRQHGQ